jgi:hypothetical protein
MKTIEMIIERTKEEILIRLSAQTNTSDLQDMIDYLEYKELVSNSKAKQQDIDELAKKVNRSMMSKLGRTIAE